VGTYLLIHGAWHGGWCWDRVAERLTAAGHAVRTPTLTGLGERAGELTPRIGLARHVADVIDALAGSTEVVLVGHSYAGMAVVGAAAERGAAVRRLVVVDGFLPERGERALDLLPERAAGHYRDSAAERGDGWRVPPRPLANLGVTDPVVLAELPPRLTDHPLRTYTDPSEHAASALPAGHYLLCAGWDSPFRPHADRARALGWTVRELDADHEIPLTAPDLLATALLELGESTAEAAREATA
jgi:pimeloyl-ACP methyl ester carboxylesterase